MNKKLKDIAIGGGIIMIISIVTALAVFFDYFRTFLSAIYFFFVPGLVISFIPFPYIKSVYTNNKNSIGWIERVVLSLALSIAIVPLLVFYLNLAGIDMKPANTLLAALGIIAISSIIIWIRRMQEKMKRIL